MMKTPRTAFLYALIILCLMTAATDVFAQRRGGRRQSSAAPSGQSEANKFWQNYAPVCNGSRYLKKAAGIFIELRGFNLQMNNEPLTSADRLNGIEAKGTSRYSATAHRTYERGKWGAWENGLPDDSTLTNSVRFQKKGGQWRFYGVGYFNDYARTLDCSELPEAQVVRGREEIPTNAIQIDDTHIFPIKEFRFAEANTNVVGNAFPKSTTTFVNWRIVYQETAFDYRLSGLEQYWYDPNGNQMAYVDKANFSNRGAGMLWWGRGWAEPGRWAVGKYTVKIYLKKRLVAQGSFEIADDEKLPGELRFDGIYRFDNAADGYVHLLRFYQDGTVLFGRTLPTNKAGLERIGACLLKVEKYAGCGTIGIRQGRYTSSGTTVAFTAGKLNAEVSADGTVGYNRLDLKTAEGIALEPERERFVFSQVRLY